MRFFVTSEDLDLEARFALHAIEKLITVHSITYGTRRNGRRRIDSRGIDQLTPLLETLQHSIHRCAAQMLSVIDALAQPEDSSIRSYFFQPFARSQIRNQQPAGERPDIDAGQTHHA